MQRELYGVSGRKFHGKDTFARLVREANENFHINHFAAALKQIASKVFGLSQEEMFDPIIKEQPFADGRTIFMDSFLDGMAAMTELDLQPAGMIATSPRNLMQYIGTEYVRKAEKDYWVKRLFRDVAPYSQVLVPDTRFPNEADAVRDQGGKVIKVRRIDMPVSPDEHPSETEIDKIDPDLLVGSVTGNLSLPSRVAYLVAKGDFDAALMYDYRGAVDAINSHNSGTKPWEASSLLRGEGDKVSVMFSLLEYYKS